MFNDSKTIPPISTITNEVECDLAENLWVELINLNPKVESDEFKLIEACIAAIESYRQKP